MSTIEASVGGVTDSTDSYDFLASDSTPTTSSEISSRIKKVYQCVERDCKYWCNLPKQFHAHMIQNHNLRAFHCTVCNYQTNWRSDVQRHIKNCIAKGDISHNEADRITSKEFEAHQFYKYNHLKVQKSIVYGEDGKELQEASAVLGIISSPSIPISAPRTRRSVRSKSQGKVAVPKNRVPKNVLAKIKAVKEKKSKNPNRSNKSRTKPKPRPSKAKAPSKSSPQMPILQSALTVTENSDDVLLQTFKKTPTVAHKKTYPAAPKLRELMPYLHKNETARAQRASAAVHDMSTKPAVWKCKTCTYSHRSSTVVRSHNHLSHGQICSKSPNADFMEQVPISFDLNSNTCASPRPSPPLLKILVQPTNSSVVKGRGKIVEQVHETIPISKCPHCDFETMNCTDFQSHIQYAHTNICKDENISIEIDDLTIQMNVLEADDFVHHVTVGFGEEESISDLPLEQLLAPYSPQIQVNFTTQDDKLIRTTPSSEGIICDSPIDDDIDIEVNQEEGLSDTLQIIIANWGPLTFHNYAISIRSPQAETFLEDQEMKNNTDENNGLDVITNSGESESEGVENSLRLITTTPADIEESKGEIVLKFSDVEKLMEFDNDYENSSEGQKSNEIVDNSTTLEKPEIKIIWSSNETEESENKIPIPNNYELFEDCTDSTSQKRGSRGRSNSMEGILNSPKKMKEESVTDNSSENEIFEADDEEIGNESDLEESIEIEIEIEHEHETEELNEIKTESSNSDDLIEKDSDFEEPDDDTVVKIEKMDTESELEDEESGHQNPDSVTTPTIPKLSEIWTQPRNRHNKDDNFVDPMEKEYTDFIESCWEWKDKNFVAPKMSGYVDLITRSSEEEQSVVIRPKRLKCTNCPFHTENEEIYSCHMNHHLDEDYSLGPRETRCDMLHCTYVSKDGEDIKEHKSWHFFDPVREGVHGYLHHTGAPVEIYYLKDEKKVTLYKEPSDLNPHRC